MRLRQRQPEPGLLHADPLRKVNSRGSRNITGYVCSRKMPGRTLDHESPNELAFIRRAEIDPRVSEIYAQPVLIRHRDADGEWHDAFPDFVIRIDDRLEIHEVKPDGQYARPDVRAKLARIADAAERHGYAYSVALASELHRSSDASAIASVWRRLKTSVHPIALRVVEDALADGPLTIGELLSTTRGHRTDLPAFHAMLAMGHVRADMTQPADEGMRLDTVRSPRVTSSTG